MKSPLSVLFILSTNFLFAQIDTTFLEMFLMEDELQERNNSMKYAQYDYSGLWTATNNINVYGIIGEDHQRLRIKFISIIKNPFDSLEYLISGKSKVENEICDLIGAIRIQEIREVMEAHVGVDGELGDNEIAQQGVLIGRYELRENEEQTHSGTFRGTLYSKWYIGKDGVVQYDDIQSVADGYMNNAFIGVWQSHRSKRQKVCNWADYRVPQANVDFDIGAGEFSVAAKYLKFGWLDTVESKGAVGNAKTSNSLTKDDEQWWKD